MAGDFSAGLRTVTTRVTTIGFEPPVPPEVLVAEDRPAFFVALGFVKNEVSDAEGRTIVSDIICGVGWRGGRGRESWKHTRYPDMITGHGISGPLLTFSHTHLWPCCLASKNLQEMGHQDGAVAQLRKDKKFKKKKGEYMRRILSSGWSALNVKTSAADRAAKPVESELPTTQDDGHALGVKEKKKKKRKAKDSEEFVVPQAGDTPGL